jgi:hypothetical protein
LVEIKRGVSKVEEKGINIRRSENTCQNHRNLKVRRFFRKKNVCQEERICREEDNPKAKNIGRTKCGPF